MTESELDFAFTLMGSSLKGMGDNKVAKCPLAQWTHTGGKDSHPSVTAKAGDPAVYRCWSCRNQGTVKKLARLYFDHSGDARAYDFVRNAEGTTDGVLWKPVDRPYGSHFKDVGRRLKKQNQKIGEEELKKLLEEVPQYAFERGITKEQVIKWEIGFDPSEKRMIFPVRDFRGTLIGVSGRDLTGTSKAKFKHYEGFKKEKVLYGEHHINLRAKRGYGVEGFMDVLAIERLGVSNCVAVMGASMSFDQMSTVKKFFDEFIFLPDGDLPGMRFCDECAERLLVSADVKVGVAGVKLNEKHVPRMNRGSIWSDTDYRFLIMDEFRGLDPDDWTEAMFQTALQNTAWYGIKNGVVAEMRDMRSQSRQG